MAGCTPLEYGAMSRAPSIVLACVLLSFLAGCAGPRGHSRWSEHFRGEVWSGAFAHQLHDPDRYVPEGLLLASVPVAFLSDDELRENRANHDVTTNTKDLADALPVALGGAALAIGGLAWASGDEGRHFEIAAESLAATAGLTQALKVAVGRRRPSGDSHSSFPSGHSSFAFAGATLLIRDLDEVVAPEWRWSEYLLYVPAAYVGAERVDASRHWASDVAVGALLGTFLTNWIHDAHESDGDDRPTIFEPSGKLDWRFCIEPTESGPAFGIALSF